MKPCHEKREALALLAAGALDPIEAGRLERHVAGCAGCRGRLAELTLVAGNLRRAAETPPAEASADFHARVLRNLGRQPRRPAREGFAARMSGVGHAWRFAWPALGALAAVVVLLLWPSNRSPAPARSTFPASAQGLAPTLCNYLMAANRSPERLEELLSRQGDGAAWGGPVPRKGVLLPE